MQKINYTEDLKKSIQILEAEQRISLYLLKGQLHFTYESLKPINLIKNSLSKVIKSPLLVDDILSTIAGLATGYVSKKIVVGTSGNLIRKSIGSILQFAITNIVAQNPETVKSIGQSIIHNICHKRESKSKLK